jgi:hypothetical protein
MVQAADAAGGPVEHLDSRGKKNSIGKMPLNPCLVRHHRGVQLHNF